MSIIFTFFMKKFFFYIRGLLVAFFLKIRVLFYGSSDKNSSLNDDLDEVQVELKPKNLVDQQIKSDNKQEALSSKSQTSGLLELALPCFKELPLPPFDYVSSDKNSSLNDGLDEEQVELKPKNLVDQQIESDNKQGALFSKSHFKKFWSKSNEREISSQLPILNLPFADNEKVEFLHKTLKGNTDNYRESSSQKTQKATNIESQVIPTVKKSSSIISSENTAIPIPPPMLQKVRNFCSELDENKRKSILSEELNKARQNLKKAKKQEVGEESHFSCNKEKKGFMELLKGTIDFQCPVLQGNEQNTLTSGSFVTSGEWEDQNSPPSTQQKQKVQTIAEETVIDEKVWNVHNRLEQQNNPGVHSHQPVKENNAIDHELVNIQGVDQRLPLPTVKVPHQLSNDNDNNVRIERIQRRRRAVAGEDEV